MKGSRMVMVALGIAVVLSMPVMGLALATPNAGVVAAHSLTREPLVITPLPPISIRTVFYGGSVIPVRIMLTDPDDNSGILGANVTVWVNGVAGASPGNVNMGNSMKELGGGMYQFNLNTKPYPAGPGSEPSVIKVLAKASDDRQASWEVTVSLS